MSTTGNRSSGNHSLAGSASGKPADATPVPLLDVGRGNRPLRDEFLAAMAQVLDSGRFLHGPEVKQLEDGVASFTGAKHAIGCASGSDALLLALMALDIGPGDEVIVPSFTFFATASAVWRVGARPVFVDIDPHSFNIDPRAVARAVTDRTKAIIPVHLFGQCADMDSLLAISRHTGAAVIEDAAQAIGAKHKGRGAGSMGAIGCLSFYPTKNLGGFGDGGMLTTNDDKLAERLRLFAAHGMNPRYYHRVVGINSRLDTLQAAVLGVKLKHLADWTEARRENAARYTRLFQESGLASSVALPLEDEQCQHVWNQFTLRIPHGRRDAVRMQLTQRGIGSEIYYPVPLHLQECFEPLGYQMGDLPHTERAAAEVLSLPIFPELTAAEQHRVVDALVDILAVRRAAA
ncbi:MAG: DegT/DnrJ/EryC1/StrS family aminotransferase [Pirellulales bacterium]